VAFQHAIKAAKSTPVKQGCDGVGVGDSVSIGVLAGEVLGVGVTLPLVTSGPDADGVGVGVSFRQ